MKNCEQSLWNYYYFLGRKYGAKPVDAASWAIKVVNWWHIHETVGNAGYMPSL